ncbi:MAG: hypothetical protein P8X47_04715 [Ignavibacteriaceae bacterium]|jgi:hypothetical protein
MNKSIIFIFILLFSFSCSKKEEVKFEAFSPEAFAYDIGDSWEVNTTVNVRGFTKIEKGNKYFVSLSYSVDLLKPDGEATKDIFSNLKDVNEKEINDVQLEAQFDLDKTYSLGKYKVVFSIKDNNSEKTTSAEAEFELEE